ncbi:YrhC family protein [Peribacillus glennii]|uniref:YrhC family protein n=1 Tax=Peribacillus glennii TaxID=2303991 RepID=A0A372LII0_9BACI|nr:YrhC family protein [Peribacillus glennii]RFU65794.1 hypothetical protein D0466_07950 [Peribacillus glennii]
MKNENTRASQIHGKVVDFQRFAVTLLCVSVFFYLGSVIPSEGKTMFITYGMMGATVVFLIGSAIFFTLSKKYKNILSDNDEVL